MYDFGQTLLANISKRFSENIRKDTRIRQIAKRVRDGTEYTDASEYAQRLGELLSEAINAETGTLSYMSEEVARELFFPLLSEDHDLACEAIRSVQQNMYSEIGVGLNPVLPELDTNRITGLVDKISGYTEFSEARWLIDEPIVNFSMSVVDQAMRDNNRKAAEAGLLTRIIRKAEPAGEKSRKIGRKTYTYKVPCKWCKDLEGNYSYREVSDEVYKRHAFCRCIVSYTIGKSTQDVWSKKYWIEEDAETKREQIADMEERLVRDRAKLNKTKIVNSLTVTHTGANKILTDYRDEIERDGLLAVIDKLKQNQNLLNEKYRSRR